MKLVEVRIENRRQRAARAVRTARYRNKPGAKEAKREYDRKRYLAGLKSGADAWRKRHPIKAKRASRDWFLRKAYGITLAEFDALAVKQKRKCAVCRRAKRLHVDHCHRTKRVRGLLCFNCNVTLGKVDDNPKLLLRLVKYLEAACV